jgi:tetratricopeptide (TPR) repeat protein
MIKRSPNIYIFLSIIGQLLCLFNFGGETSAQVTITEKDWVLPTYPVAAPDKNPVFFKNEAYQGASRRYYPYALNDQYTGERIDHPWKTLILENEYIELGITPEIGGKLYYATDKSNDYHFIYKNNVVKPSNIGMTGAWVSGGIEWCVMHHHRPSTFLPTDYTTKENKDGSKTIWVGEYEPHQSTRWIIGVTVFPGKSYFKTEGRIYNSSPLTHTFLYWANVAAHANENYQTVFPPSAQVVTFHSKTAFTRWPYSTDRFAGGDFTSGVDISWWKNVTGHNSFFVHELKEDFMGGYDHGKNAGTVHIGDHNIVKGAKLWEWGSGERGQATEAKLTENDGPYVEIMVGAYSDNQPDYSWIRPYEVKRWEQYWYPVKGIKGFKNANINAAVNLEKEGGNRIFLGYYSTQELKKAKIILKYKDKIIFEKEGSISPDNPFAESIKVNKGFELSELYTELVNLENGDKIIDYRHIETLPVKELNERWRGYPDPEKIETVEDLYLTGSRVEQFHAPRHNPMDWYMEALRRDSGDIRSNTAVGNIFLKKGDYGKAKEHLLIAIERLTRDYTRPSTGEALYLYGLTLKALGLHEEAVDTLYRAAWDYAFHSAAYYQLAQISVMKGDLEKALYQVNEALSTNSRSNLALALKSAILRKKRDMEGAKAILDQAIENDPLDFRLRNECYLVEKSAGQIEESQKILSSLKTEMRDYHENYLELAVGYVNDGCLSEAEEVLIRYNSKQPIVLYYLGYIYHLDKKQDKALRYFLDAADQPVDYVFPHRLKTIEVLNTALKYNPADGKAYYYQGNILYEKQPETAIENWQKAVKNSPDLAIAYRNLGWGYYRHYDDGQSAIGYYEKAIALNPNEAIYYTELDALYEMRNTPVATRLKLFDGRNEVVINRDDAFIRQISVLTLAGQADKAVQYLDGFEFAYREGTSEIRDLIIDAKLMLGKKYMEEKNYTQALNVFKQAQLPDEEAGNARFGNRGIQVNYYIGSAYEALGDLSKAKEYFAIASSQDYGRSYNIMSFYKGLSLIKMGKETEAAENFIAMIEYANRRIEDAVPKEAAGVIFGEAEAENTRMSQSFTIRGLGNKGLGNTDKAKKDLNKAVELSYSNLWAKAELE